MPQPPRGETERKIIPKLYNHSQCRIWFKKTGRNSFFIKGLKNEHDRFNFEKKKQAGEVLNVAFKKYNASMKRIVFFYKGVEF